MVHEPHPHRSQPAAEPRAETVGRDRPVEYFRGRPTVESTFFKEPFRFDFFQAVRIAEQLYVDTESVGKDAALEKECLRFKALPSLVFPASQIYDIRPPDTEQQRCCEMTVAFMGLTGPSGTLPRFYTEMILDRARLKDTTLRDFLDLLNHRLISLFYRAWEKYRFFIGYERAGRLERRDYRNRPDRQRSFVCNLRPGIDRFSQCLLELAGLGPADLRYSWSHRQELQPRTTVADATIRYFVGLLSHQHRSAIGLQGMLAEYFDCDVQIRQFVGQWLFLEPENQSRLVGQWNTQLGSTAIIGQRFWDRQSRFRVQLGPLSIEQFHKFLPVGSAFRELSELCRLYAGAQFDMEVQPVLRAQDVPWCQLQPADKAPRLGWNTWIHNAVFTADAGDVTLGL